MVIDASLPESRLRLVLSFDAAALIGRERGSIDHAAGLRTTMLVTPAALATAAGGLPATQGEVQGGASMDVLRPPLGISTGVGFLGTGAILRRGRPAKGPTTAATLGAATAIGIVLGDRECALGIMATALCFGSLYGLIRCSSAST